MGFQKARQGPVALSLLPANLDVEFSAAFLVLCLGRGSSAPPHDDNGLHL